MSKKSSREIPDFSRKSSRPKGAGATNAAPNAAPNALPAAKQRVSNASAPRPKPQSSSAKSGQRGK